jgi:hypothetical protein
MELEEPSSARPAFNLARSIDLIGKMSLGNPLRGVSRIHGELLNLGFELSESMVAKYKAPLRIGSRSNVQLGPLTRD